MANNVGSNNFNLTYPFFEFSDNIGGYKDYSFI